MFGTGCCGLWMKLREKDMPFPSGKCEIDFVLFLRIPDEFGRRYKVCKIIHFVPRSLDEGV